METLATFLATALGYILNGAANSKTAAAAKEEVLGRFWGWIRPRFIKELPEVETTAEAPETQAKAEATLLKLVQDKDFFEELVQRVVELQEAGLEAKNIVGRDIKRVRKIRIGDKEYSPNEQYRYKNIVKGNVEDADEFTLGDGH